MSIYMQINEIKGNVTTEGFANTIEIISLSESIERYVSPMLAGRNTDRQAGSIAYQAIEIIKVVDQSSMALYSALHKSDTLATVKITFTRTHLNEITPFLEYTLSEVLITGIHTITTYNKLIETILLNFTKIQKRFIPATPQNTSSSPVVAGYDIKIASAF